jgi:hypothetical protein
MGTRLMQWTAGEMDGMQMQWMECNAMDCCGFVYFMFFGLCFMLDVN